MRRKLATAAITHVFVTPPTAWNVVAKLLCNHFCHSYRVMTLLQHIPPRWIYLYNPKRPPIVSPGVRRISPPHNIPPQVIEIRKQKYYHRGRLCSAEPGIRYDASIIKVSRGVPISICLREVSTNFKHRLIFLHRGCPLLSPALARREQAPSEACAKGQGRCQLGPLCA